MKKHFIAFIAVVTVGFLFLNFTIDNAKVPSQAGEKNFEIPENIQAIVDNSCYGCHNSESQNEKGMKKLMFDKMGELKTSKLVGALADIAEVVEEGDMPPAKILKKYPDMTLTDEDKATLIEWANSTAEKLAGE